MKKFGWLLIILSFFGVAVFIAMVLYGGGQQRSSAVGLPAGAMKEVALRERVVDIALADPDVNKAIDGLQGNYDVEAVEYIGPEDVGYIGYNGTLMRVRIRTHPIMEYVYYDVIVDVDKMKEMGVRYGGSPIIMMGVHDWAIIPPGAYWYIHIINGSHSLSREVSVQTIRAGVEFEPKDATVYVMILDEGNFTKFKNGAPFDTPVLIDTSTNKSIKVDGSQPISSGWKPGLTMPPARLKYPGFDNGDYLVSLDLVVKNGESSRDIKVISTGFP